MATLPTADIRVMSAESARHGIGRPIIFLLTEGQARERTCPSVVRNR
jgi:hypothetical protein